ncbi:hypothetical protein LSTR_LSTR005719 [Laodelphax striatellus]|uniref:Uncharacterized protein n=1 Tax=Laodelphax striatellus TaxID=195883 RepID=A0A482XIM7_LAOST|nr:hypothetical protein LSTR_LSTR005719 [Laodelphax striatellus]
MDSGRQKIPMTDYFILVTRGVWRCTVREKKLPSFLRVVNELVSVKEISELRFYDGVEVSVLRYVGYKVNARVMEIKYVSEETARGKAAGTALKIDGCLRIIKGSSFVPYTPNLNEVVYSRVAEVRQLSSYDRYSKSVIVMYDTPEIQFRIPAAKSLHSSKGRSLLIGSPATVQYDQSAARLDWIFKCFPYYHTTPYSRTFRTDVQEHVVDKHVYAIINDDEFSNIFVIAHRKLHVCYYKTESFIRVEQDVIGRVPLKQLEYQPSTIVQLSSVKVSGGTSVVFKEIKYIDSHGTFLQPFQFRPPIIIYSEEHHSLRIGGKIDTRYLLRNYLHLSRTLISNDGYDLRIEQPIDAYYNCDMLWTRYDDDNCDTTKNKIGNTYTFNKMSPDEIPRASWQEPSIWIKVVRDGNYQTIEPIMDEGNQLLLFNKPILKLLSRDVWSCVLYKEYLHTIIRVENRFKVLIPVRELETSDGVEIINTALEHGGKSVEILEKKYFRFNFDPSQYQRPSQYIQFSCPSFFKKGSESSSYERFRKLAIKKTADDTVHLIAPESEQGFTVKDVLSNNVENVAFKDLKIGKGTSLLSFNVNPLEPRGQPMDIADCKLEEKNKYQQVRPNFIVLDKNDRTIERNADGSKYKEYFETLEKKVWKCLLRSDPGSPLLRVVHEHVLKRDLPYDVGTIRHFIRDDVWMEMKDGDAVVRLRETKYLDATTPTKALDYKGLHLLVQDLKPEWKSGTRSLPNLENIHIKNRIYDSLPMNYSAYIHKTAITPKAPQGATLVIDTAWKKVVGDRSMKVTCSKNNDQFPWHRTVVRNETGDDVFFNHFISVGKESWTCSNTQRKISFTRVIHQFIINPATMDKIKYLHHLDGVTMFAGFDTIENMKLIEIAVVKYHEQSNENPIVKYEGKLVLKDGSAIPTVKAKRLASIGLAFRDVYYTLPTNAVFKTFISYTGRTMEILPFSKLINEKMAEYVNSYYPSVTADRKPYIVYCWKYQFQNAYDEQKMLEWVKPLVVLNQHIDGGGNPMRMFLDLQTLQNIFTFNYDVQFCKRSTDNSGPVLFYRVVNKLVQRTEHCKIAVLYFHNGVTVDKDDDLKITEIKYYDKDWRLKIFEGFTTVNEDSQIPIESASNQGVREINYWPEIMWSTNFIRPDGVGVTMEVGSEWSTEIKATKDPVTCKRLEGIAYLESCATSVYIVKVSQKQHEDSEWHKIKDLGSIFIDVIQKIYTCERNGEVIFHRVVTELLSEKAACVYYGDGVGVGWYKYPDKRTFLKIREVKYVDPTTKKVLKYDGQLVVITDISNLVERLYEGNVDFREDKLCMHDHNMFTEDDMINANEVVEYNNGKMYRLDYVAKKQLKRKVKLKVWICANKKDTILRMEARIKMLFGNISGIIHPDSVVIKRKDYGNEDSSHVKFIETFYLSARTSKVLKIEGQLPLIVEMRSPPPPPPPPVQVPRKKKRICGETKWLTLG